ncbi:MAG: hypothetical protein V1758_07060 [Pseudomonadota bacterium]
MYGWRGKIGFISPIVAETSIRAFYEMLPEGVAIVLTCLSIQDFDKDEFKSSKAMIDRAAEDLARAKVDCLIVGGAPLVWALDGYGSDKAIVDRIEEKWHIPTTTAQTAQVEALKAMGVGKIVLCAPPAAHLQLKKKEFIEKSGLQVLATKGLNLTNNVDVAKQPPFVAYQLAREAYLEAPEADGILLACSQWRNIEYIQKLEADLGVTVVASNQAMIWWGLKSLGIRDRITGYGRLLASLSEG